MIRFNVALSLRDRNAERPANSVMSFVIESEISSGIPVAERRGYREGTNE